MILPPDYSSCSRSHTQLPASSHSHSPRFPDADQTAAQCAGSTQYKEIAEYRDG